MGIPYEVDCFPSNIREAAHVRKTVEGKEEIV